MPDNAVFDCATRLADARRRSRIVARNRAVTERAAGDGHAAACLGAVASEQRVGACSVRHREPSSPTATADNAVRDQRRAIKLNATRSAGGHRRVDQLGFRIVVEVDGITAALPAVGDDAVVDHGQLTAHKTKTTADARATAVVSRAVMDDRVLEIGLGTLRRRVQAERTRVISTPGVIDAVRDRARRDVNRPVRIVVCQSGITVGESDAVGKGAVVRDVKNPVFSSTVKDNL